jgi:hypothetical protein
MGNCTGRVHGAGRSRLAQRVRCRAGCPQLGVASSPVRASRLGVLLGATAAPQLKRTVADIPDSGRLGIAAVGGGYETVRESLDARAYPMPGQLIAKGQGRCSRRPP